MSRKTIEITYGLRITHTVTESHLVWALHYLKDIKNIPYHKVSRSKLNDFIKGQMLEFGERLESLAGSSYDEDAIPDDEYAKIMKAIDRIFTINSRSRL